MWDLIPRKLMPPTRVARYCCAVLKEQNGKGRFLATGVRWAESVSRSKRRGIFEKQVSNRDKEVHIRNDEESLDALFAPCKLAAKRFVNPIVDWSDREVWDFFATMSSGKFKKGQALSKKAVFHSACPFLIHVFCLALFETQNYNILDGGAKWII